MDLAADVDWEAAAAVGWLPVAAEGLIAPGGRIVAAVGRGAAAVGARAADEMGSGRGVDNVAPAGACDGPGREVCWWGAACGTPLPPGKSRVLQDPVPAASVDDHGAHLAVGKAAVHLVAHSWGALVPKAGQGPAQKAVVGHDRNAALRPALAHTSHVRAADH